LGRALPGQGVSYRGTSLIRNRRPLGPYSRTMPKDLRGSWGGVKVLLELAMSLRRWSSNPSGKRSYERPTRGTVCGTMRRMCGADAGYLVTNYRSCSHDAPAGRAFPGRFEHRVERRAWSRVVQRAVPGGSVFKVVLQVFLESLFAKVNSHTTSSTYSIYQ